MEGLTEEQQQLLRDARAAVQKELEEGRIQLEVERRKVEEERQGLQAERLKMEEEVARRERELQEQRDALETDRCVGLVLCSAQRVRRALSRIRVATLQCI